MPADPFQRFAKDLRRGGNKSVPSALVQYIDLIAGRILTTAKKNAPVRTGALRRSGRIERRGSKTEPVRIVSFGGQATAVQYAAAVEFGRFAPVGRQRGSTTTPQPYLRPALVSEMRRSRPEMKRILNKNLQHLNKTYRGSI